MTDPPVEAEVGHDLARRDWLVFGEWRELHGAAELTDEQASALFDAGADNVTMLCGRVESEVVLPGVLSRMSASRCAACCDSVGYPHGDGSPKNEPDIAAANGWDEGAWLDDHAPAARTEAWLDSLDPTILASSRADATDLRAVVAAASNLNHAIATARANGKTWLEIAAVLDVSRTDAQRLTVILTQKSESA